jgi:hypothetical protein
MYIRSKTLDGKDYFQVVEGRREGGKVKQSILVSLGSCPTVAEATARWRRRLTRMRRERALYTEADVANSRRAAARAAALDRGIARAEGQLAKLAEVGGRMAEQAERRPRPRIELGPIR